MEASSLTPIFLLICNGLGKPNISYEMSHDPPWRITNKG